MKKNVFSRAIAVLASMTVLGAASMMSASAAGVVGASVEAKAGETAVVAFNLSGTASNGAEATFTVEAPLSIVSVDGAMADETTETSSACVFVSGKAIEDGGELGSIEVKIAEDAQPGSYPVNIEVTNLDNGNSGSVENPEGVAGTVVVVADETEPVTEPVTEPTTAAPVATTAAPTTAAKKSDSPKTGTAGVAVAVAGLVTAGATAVVLKKKH